MVKLPRVSQMLLLSLVACGERPKSQSNAAPTAYQQAVVAASARGDTMLAAGDTSNARAIWEMLVGLDSANTDAANRLRSAPGRPLSPSVEEIRWVDRITKVMDTDLWCAFPAKSPEASLVNAKMMGDAQLLPTLRTVGLRAPSGVCDDKDAFLPLGVPTVTMAEVRERYGAPAGEAKQADGSIVLTYGRFRVFGDKDGKAIAVVIPSFSE